jgi:hypothetical protein
MIPIHQALRPPSPHRFWFMNKAEKLQYKDVDVQAGETFISSSAYQGVLHMA